MSKVTIRAKVTIDKADYDKIMEFAAKDERNAPLADLGKLIEDQVTINLKGIIAQITVIETKVKLTGPDGKPLIAIPGRDM